MYQRPDFGLPRTKNTVEVWHRAFQHTVGSTHVKVYRLINSIGLEESHTENVTGKIDAGQNVIKKNKKYLRVTAVVRRLVDNFNQRNR